MQPEESKGEVEFQMEERMNAFLVRDDVQAQIRDAQSEGQTKLNINLDAIRKKDPKLSQYLLRNPVKGIGMFEKRLGQMLADSMAAGGEKLAAAQGSFPTPKPKLKLNLSGNVGRNFVTPRGLKAHLINQLVKVQGIVTRMSIVRPKLKKSYHYCEKTKQGMVQSYADQYQVGATDPTASKSGMFPTMDAAQNPLTPDYGFMQYEDH